MRRIALAAAVVTALVAPAAADAQTIQAVDGTEANHYENTWSPNTVTIRVGETVTWSFTGSQVFHNVVSDSTNWSFRNDDPKVAPPPATYQFTAPGTYRFICQIHATTMWGDVIVTDTSGNPPPPPPPPPLSEQPFPNDTGAPTALEVPDTLRPRLTHVKVRARGHTARLRFRIDEPGVVTLRVKRTRLTVKRRRTMVLKGTHTLTVRGLRPGRYRFDLAARDLAGNRSAPKRARATVR